jgi:GNAT superfamily N-acetyltransferase
MTSVEIRPYLDTDADGWLQCRLLLSFFRTQYYDDVVIERPSYTSPSIQLVAVADDVVVGLLDIETSGEAATIEVIAVHPAYARQGVATALLNRALTQLRIWGAKTLDAWTREDEAANRWYCFQHFSEQHRYLHVHKEWDDDTAGFSAPEGLSAPVRAFSHAPLNQEADVRSRFRRVYQCRQYVRDLAPH